MQPIKGATANRYNVSCIPILKENLASNICSRCLLSECSVLARTSKFRRQIAHYNCTPFYLYYSLHNHHIGLFLAPQKKRKIYFSDNGVKRHSSEREKKNQGEIPHSCKSIILRQRWETLIPIMKKVVSLTTNYRDYNWLQSV